MVKKFKSKRILQCSSSDEICSRPFLEVCQKAFSVKWIPEVYCWKVAKVKMLKVKRYRGTKRHYKAQYK